MKEYLSPGTYIELQDRSFLSTNLSIGSTAVFIGGFAKGTAFVPMLIKDGPDLINKTGLPTGKLYSQYAALLYSKHAGNFWVQRLLWSGGYTADALVIYGKTSSTDTLGDVLAILASAGNELDANTLTLAGSSSFSGTNDMLTFSVSGKASNGIVQSITKSLSVANLINVLKTFSSNPYQLLSPIYLYARVHDTSSLDIYLTISIVKSPDLLNFSGSDYKNAVTPWITDLNGAKLFRFNHLSDGSYTNKDVKVHIKNIKTSSTAYTKFDVVIRQYGDTERRQIVLLAFYEVNLDPMSDSYIGRRIGDTYVSWDLTTNKLMVSGDYRNNSNFVRVLLGLSVKNRMIGMGTTINTCQQIPLWWGLDSGYDSLYPSDFIYTASLSSPGGFDVTKFGIQLLSNPSTGSTIPTSSTLITFECDNFVIPFYGGFDGTNPSIGYVTDENTLMGFDMSTKTSTGVVAYKKALDMMKNTDLFDIELISIAGTNIKDSDKGKREIYRYALLEICEYRGDCIVATDLNETDDMTIATALMQVLNFDSSYGAVYFPSVKYYDGYTRTYPVLPVSTLIPAVIAYTKKMGLPHYAPAGIDRGTLNVVQAMSKLSKALRDTLYKFRINPIASFAGTGTVVWGQKTLQKASSALDRINVRFSVNQIKKWITRFGMSVLFNNNTATLRTVFSIGVNTYMDRLVANGGLYEYRFQMDDSNNTPEVIDRNQLIGLLWIKPTKTAEFIIIPINIVRTDSQL